MTMSWFNLLLGFLFILGLFFGFIKISSWNQQTKKPTDCPTITGGCCHASETCSVDKSASKVEGKH
jgi:hypothetical protein